MEQRAIRIGCLLLVLVLGRFVWASFHMHPVADDWAYAAEAIRDPSLERILAEYSHWNGRWFSNFLVLRGPLVLGLEQGLWLYRVVPVLVLAGTWLAGMAVWRGWCGRRLPLVEGALFSGLWLACYLQVMPQLHEGIYWYTGAVTYQLPTILLMLLVASWRIHQRSGRLLKRLLLAANALLIVVIAGSSEVHMVLVLALSCVLLALRRWQTGTWEPVPMFFVLLALVAAFIMLSAPGNTVRSFNYPDRQQAGHSLLMAILHTGRFTALWVLHPMVLLTALAWALYDRNRGFTRTWRIPVWSPVLHSLVLVLLIMFMPFWSTGMLGQHRTVNVALAVFLPGWFLTIGLLFRRITLPAWRETAPVRVLVPALGVVALVVGTGWHLSHDLLSGRLARYDRAMLDRYSRITEAVDQGREEVVLPDLEPMPRAFTILHARVGEIPWLDGVVVLYFGAPDLRLRPTDHVQPGRQAVVAFVAGTLHHARSSTPHRPPLGGPRAP
jgi:hypothetical protein